MSKSISRLILSLFIIVGQVPTEACTTLGEKPHHLSLAKPDAPSVHGMLMFGKSKIYLSHLPMFHSPHDYQVIIEASIEPKALEVYRTSLQTSNEQIYTIVPQVFVLPDLTKSLKSFRADIFQGHFERGGHAIANSVTVTVENVIYFQKFDPNATKPTKASYLIFGNDKEQFLAHKITAKPDFDEIVRLVPSPIAAGALRSKNVFGIQIGNLANSTPLEPGKEFTAESDELKQPLQLKTDSVIYLETGDLS